MRGYTNRMKTTRDGKQPVQVQVQTTDDVVATTDEIVDAGAMLDVSSDERMSMIADQAYQLAEARGFEPGHELEDWLTAERAIDDRLAGHPHV